MFQLASAPGNSQCAQRRCRRSRGALSQCPRRTDSRRACEILRGVGRRFEVKGVFSGITVMDDYGHHPGRNPRHARSRARHANSSACSSSFSRIAIPAPSICGTTSAAPSISPMFSMLTDIYAASEQPSPAVTGEALAKAIRAAGHKNVVYLPARCRRASSFCCAKRKPGDAYPAIGAGNVSRASSNVCSWSCIGDGRTAERRHAH